MATNTGRGHKRVSDEDLVASYRHTGNIHKTGKEFGITGGSVHERLVRLGVQKSINRFSKADQARLTRDYAAYRAAGKVSDLASSMGRTVQFLSRQARVLGLTTHRFEKQYARVWKGMPEETARTWFEAFTDCRLTLTQFCAKHRIDDGGFRLVARKYFPAEWEAAIELKAPRQSRYRYGREFEYRVRDLMRDHGFFALRSPASRTPIDILAIRHGLVLFIQCKRDGHLSVKEWNTLFTLAESVGAIPILAGTPTGKGISLWRLLSRKDGTKRGQPFELYIVPSAKESR